jgi:hypothetical protein
MRLPMTERPATDDELKAQFLAAVDDSGQSYRDIRRRLGWSKETSDRVVGLLLAENKIKTIAGDDKFDEDYKQYKRQFRSGLLSVRPRWFGRLLYITGALAQYMSYAIFFGIAGLILALLDKVGEALAAGTDLVRFFGWHNPFVRWSVVAIIVGLLGMMYDEALSYVSARIQGIARHARFSKMLFRVIGVVPRVLWALLILVIRAHLNMPPGGPPENNIPVRAEAISESNSSANRETSRSAGEPTGNDIAHETQ